jgi:hypothetical protein
VRETEVWDGDDSDEDAGGIFEPESGMAVWVQAEKCDTCIFWPGNRMHLHKGLLQELVREAVADRSHIPCHDTLLYGRRNRLRPAMCRGYHDHPQGNEASMALDLGRSLGTIHYQQPTKEPSMLLAELLATTGLSMRLKRGDIQKHSTGWTSREWKVTYVADGKPFRTTFRLGNVDEDPNLLECLTHSLDVVRQVRAVKSYEEWGKEQSGSDDPATWSPRTAYMEQVRHSLRLADFFGDMMDTYLEAYGANTAEHQDQAPANLDALLPGMDVKRAVLEGVEWMVPDCTHEGDGPLPLCTWRVLAVHQHRVRVAGLVREINDGYRAVTWDADRRELHHQPHPFRELAIADVTRAYDPARHDAPRVVQG